MKFFISFFLVFSYYNSFGQEKRVSDNLSERDSLMYLELKQKFSKHINPNPDSSLLFISKIKTFSQKKDYKIGIVEASYFKAFYFRRIQKLDSAVFYFNKASKLAEKHNYLRGIALAQNGLCRVYYFLGQNDNAIKACEKCLDVAYKINDLAITTDTYTALGNTYSRKNNLKTAVGYFLKADSIHNKTPQRPDVIAGTYQSLGSVFEDLKDYDRSIEYFSKANEEFRKIPADVTFYLNTTDIYLGSVYYRKGNLVKADSLLQRSYVYFKKINDKSSIAQISTLIGLIRLKQEEFNEAETYLSEGFQLNKDEKYSYETAEAVLELGKLYVKKNEPKKAVYYFNELLVNYNDDNNASLQLETLQSMAEAYALDKNYRKAFVLSRQAIKLKDSLNSAQNLASIREIEEAYQSEKKEQQIVILKSQKELVEQQKASQRNQLLGGLGVTALTGVFFFFLYRNRQRTTKKLQKLDIAKSSFFANISHEFRTPLTLISGPIQQQLNKKDLSSDERSNFKMVHRNTKRLLSLVDQLLDISKAESGDLKLLITNSKITPFIGSLADSFSFRTKEKKIDYKINIEASTIDSWFDKDVLEKIITNLISNAVKYTPENGKIECNTIIKDHNISFVIKNSGKGMTKDQLEKVFNRFYQISEDNKGTGIGLALVKELVTLHKGTINVESIPNNWTTFTVKLPITKKAFKESEITIHAKSNDLTKKEINYIDTIETDIIIDNSSIDEDKPILLIVDDNTDIRTYVSSIFKKSYTVLQAKNGQEGIDIAIEQIPDIIISDIMMPIKNGIELCNTLKVDERTSHIPIILLTAKAGEENEIEGIKTGADDYITKPFNNQLLKLKVEKLLENIKKLQKRFSQEIILKSSDISISSTDELFLNRLQGVLDGNLVESTFNTDNFCKSINMSRMQLHRKLKALFNMTTSEFIRSQRLKLAADLLKTSDVTVSQVGYSVGFNDPAYFSKRFKEVYNCTPTQYAKNSN